MTNNVRKVNQNSFHDVEWIKTEDLHIHNFLSDIMSGDEDEVQELMFDEHFYREDE